MTAEDADSLRRHFNFSAPRLAFNSLSPTLTGSREMLARLVGRQHTRPVRLAYRASLVQKHAQYTFNLRARDALIARRAWSSSTKRSQDNKDNGKSDSGSKDTKPNFFERARTVARWTALLGASSVVGVLLLGGAIFLHDACTYTSKHIDRVPVHPLALHPEVGGPKKLPVAKVLVGDEEDEENKKLMSKPRLVIVGGGWGVRTPYLRVFKNISDVRRLLRPWASSARSSPGNTMLR